MTFSDWLREHPREALRQKALALSPFALALGAACLTKELIEPSPVSIAAALAAASYLTTGFIKMITKD